MVFVRWVAGASIPLLKVARLLVRVVIPMFAFWLSDMAMGFWTPLLRTVPSLL